MLWPRCTSGGWGEAGAGRQYNEVLVHILNGAGPQMTHIDIDIFVFVVVKTT